MRLVSETTYQEAEAAARAYHALLAQSGYRVTPSARVGKIDGPQGDEYCIEVGLPLCQEAWGLDIEYEGYPIKLKDAADSLYSDCRLVTS